MSALKTTVKAAFLVRNSIGKESRLIGENAAQYLGIQKALKKALEPYIDQLEKLNEKSGETFKEFNARQRQINMSSKTSEEKDSEVKALTAEMAIAMEPHNQKMEEFNSYIDNEPLEITFDRNNFAWLKEHITKNALFLTKNQDPSKPSDNSVNDEALEVLFEFVGNE